MDSHRHTLLAENVSYNVCFFGHLPLFINGHSWGINGNSCSYLTYNFHVIAHIMYHIMFISSFVYLLMIIRGTLMVIRVY